MKCPKGSGNLSPFDTAEGAGVEFCNSCEGTLLDRGDVAKHFELTKDIPDLEKDLTKAKRTKFLSPKREGERREIPYAPGSKLLVDLSVNCGAIWLDKGEFTQLERLAA